MTENDERMSRALHDLAHPQLTTGPIPVADLLRRGRRTRRLRNLARTGAGAGCLALAVAAGLAVVPGSSSGSPAQTLMPASPAVQSTVAAPRAEGYHVTLTYTIQQENSPQPQHTNRYTGAVDPDTDRAFLNGEDGGFHYRFTDGEEYVDRNGWRRGDMGTGPRGTLPVGQLLTRDPKDLLDQLRSLGTVTRSAGAGGDESYTFSYVSVTSPYTGEPAEHAGDVPTTVTGSVELVGGRYRSITLQCTITGPEPETADRIPITRKLAIAFTDAGAPVTVERPTLPSS